MVADGTPLELLQFWREARAADLFVDAQYGQWGLRILSPTQSIRKTAKLRVDSSAELIEGDLVVGEFLGDSDLLLVRCDPAARDYGCVLVVLPIDKRKDWPTIAANFSQFISRFAESSGDKFWENAAI